MTVRKPEIRDAEKLLHYFQELVEKDPERVERPEDAKSLSVQDEKQWIKSLKQKEEQDEIYTLIAESDGNIVAEGEIERKPRWIERHVAEIRFGMLPGYEDETIEMLNKLMNKTKGVEVLIYFHLETQKTGIKIMETLGFREAGRIENYYKKEGDYIDRIYYTKQI